MFLLLWLQFCSCCLLPGTVLCCCSISSCPRIICHNWQNNYVGMQFNHEFPASHCPVILECVLLQYSMWSMMYAVCAVLHCLHPQMPLINGHGLSRCYVNFFLHFFWTWTSSADRAVFPHPLTPSISSSVILSSSFCLRCCTVVYPFTRSLLCPCPVHPNLPFVITKLTGNSSKKCLFSLHF